MNSSREKLRFSPRPGLPDDPFAGINWTKRLCEIRDMSGEVIFSMADCEFPDFWSQNAANVCAQKYFRKAGVPSLTTHVPEEGIPLALARSTANPGCFFGAETSLKQVISRLTGCWTYWGWKEGLFHSLDDALVFRNECAWLLAFQYMAPNSPQFFNTGLFWAYGIAGEPQGFWYCDPEDDTIKESPNSYERVAAHACFLLGLKDDLVKPGGIMDLWHREARVFKFGGGSGTSLSNLRSQGEPLSGGGQASGPMSFARTGDTSAGSIKSGGTTRRAAKLICMGVDHPDIEEFIDWKVHEEDKVAFLVAGSQVVREAAEAIRSAVVARDDDALMIAEKNALENGVPDTLVDRLARLFTLDPQADLPKEMDVDWRGEAYRTVQGQNANNSVRVSNDFMSAVASGSDWHLKRRTDGKVSKTLPAQKLWKKMCLAAWKCADPGIHFHTTINEWNTTPEMGDIEETNPCSEVHQTRDTACNLLSLNLLRLFDGAKFDTDLFMRACRLGTVILEITVEMAHFPSREVARNTQRLRQLGLGYTNMGGLLMALGMPYDSDRGRAVAAAVTCLMHSQAGVTSAEMARAVGPFAEYDRCKDSMLRVMRNHRAAAFSEAVDEHSQFEGLSIQPQRLRSELLLLDARLTDLAQAARRTACSMVEMGEKYGYRNSQFTVIPPTGTISLIMDADTTGIEPDFALVKYKSLAGGGNMKIANQTITRALYSLGYTDGEVKQITAHVEATDWLDGAPALREEHLGIFDCAMESPSGRSISPEGHVRMVAAVQPFLSGAASKTINTPASYTPEDFSNLYWLSWTLMVKCMAAYRNNSKMSQPLGTRKKKKAEKSLEVSRKDVNLAIRRMQAHSGVESSGLRRGQRELLPDRRPGETQKFRVGGNMKVYLRTGEYPDGRLGEIWLDTHKDGAAFRSILHGFAVAVSLGLQHGVPLDTYIKAFTNVKFEPNGVVQGHKSIKMTSSILDMIFRDLAINYLGRTDLANVKPEEDRNDLATKTHADDKRLRPGRRLVMEESAVGSRINSHDGNGHSHSRDGLSSECEGTVVSRAGSDLDACAACGNYSMRKTGPCARCDLCGETTGCG